MQDFKNIDTSDKDQESIIKKVIYTACFIACLIAIFIIGALF